MLFFRCFYIHATFFLRKSGKNRIYHNTLIFRRFWLYTKQSQPDSLRNTYLSGCKR